MRGFHPCLRRRRPIDDEAVRELQQRRRRNRRRCGHRREEEAEVDAAVHAACFDHRVASQVLAIDEKSHDALRRVRHGRRIAERPKQSGDAREKDPCLVRQDGPASGAEGTGENERAGEVETKLEEVRNLE